jgi:hypothetical protein
MKRTSLRPRSLGRADFETLAEFRYLLRQFGAFSAAAARQAGLTAQQHQVLLAVKGFPRREQVRIALTPQAEKLLLGLTLAHWDELRRLAPLLRGLLRRLEESGR